jgi:DNA-binding NarL/FixJ family response regulator
LETVKELGNHFLILENDADDAFLIRRAFSNFPLCSAFVCRNTSEARAYMIGAGMYADRERYPVPTAVVSDVCLEGESGVDFLRWLRNTAAFANIPVYILTGSASPEQVDAASKLGAAGVFSKPVKIQALQELIRSIAVDLCKNTRGE